jgi:hypothetical protein
MTNTPTIPGSKLKADEMTNKEKEIMQLDNFITLARESGADYLYDALMALTGPFESAIRSDYPGEWATKETLDLSRSLREERDAIESRVVESMKEFKTLSEEKAKLKRGIEALSHRLDELADSADTICLQARKASGNK